MKNDKLERAERGPSHTVIQRMCAKCASTLRMHMLNLKVVEEQQQTTISGCAPVSSKQNVNEGIKLISYTPHSLTEIGQVKIRNMHDIVTIVTNKDKNEY